MSNTFIFPYKADSQGAIALSEKLDCYRISRQNSRFIGNANRTVINWGWGDPLPSEVMKCRIINKPEAVARCVNKIESFTRFIANRVNVPPYTRDYDTALQWFRAGYQVYCRSTATGMDGAGVTVVHSAVNTELPRGMSFYTKRVACRDEYRVNIVGDEVVAFQMKVPVTGHPTPINQDVRTTGGGWGFIVKEEWEVPQCLDSEAVAAVKALGLDFGGVDIIYSSDTQAYVLEVNSAPHLTPYSADKYAAAFKEMIGE